MRIAVVAPVAAAYPCSSSLAAPASATSRAHVAAAGMSYRASSFVGGGLAAVVASVAARPRRAGSGRGDALGCKCLFGLGVPELAVIAGVAALVFGPKQLPEIGRSLGKTVKSFQEAAKEFESELKKEPGEGGDQPPPATPTATGVGGAEKGLEASSSKESTSRRRGLLV
ncbi:Sec-independent protein translocase protein TATA, chloroplastic [Zea mays]|uniref:THA9 n=2 Tax=Zea mays TaxID=4577 RepID=Q9XFJ9_MAIZE|nr:Sec-independent protein translocase protein TATA, chloroplastic [Zea mays]AAD31523.1 THA9 [Zea mays]PWZ22206.1 Sec-independent protein translocase protein TATA, chloroplastic [Zea mays]|eukprot:NP_001104943.1 uncharacterized protein LOC541789 [Zea mays]